jgi:hypothetical protein
MHCFTLLHVFHWNCLSRCLLLLVMVLTVAVPPMLLLLLMVLLIYLHRLAPSLITINSSRIILIWLCSQQVL